MLYDKILFDNAESTFKIKIEFNYWFFDKNNTLRLQRRAKSSKIINWFNSTIRIIATRIW
jgi:isopentenyldiphosphate isomerase